MKLSDLRKPLPDSKISHRTEWERQKDGSTIERDIAYISWHTAADVLDDSAPDFEIVGPWGSMITDVKAFENKVVVVMSIYFPVKDAVENSHTVSRQAIGFEYLIDPKTGKEISYGDAFSNASSMAFRRCCAMFGIGRELYKKTAGGPIDRVRSRSEFEAADRRDASRPRQEAPSNPLATSADDMITPRQLVAIRAICNSQGFDAEQACTEMYGSLVPLNELSRKAASALIDRIKTKQD